MIKAHDVSFHIEGQIILDHISFSVNQGEFVYLVGQTGVGKSSLLKLLYLENKPLTGKISIHNISLETLDTHQIPFHRRKIGVIFQDFRLFDDRDVFENVAFALYVTNTPSKEIKKQVLIALAEVGLSHKKHQPINELSGGEKQRVAIARAIVNTPLLLLADEPTGNLDPITSAGIVELLKKINMRGTTILMATHNYELVKKYPSRILQLAHGQLKEVMVK